jgi:Cu+-exporting ATPase
MAQIRLHIEGMHCVGCAMTIDGALEDLPGVRSASTNYARQMVDVDYDERIVSEAQLIAAVAAAGYTATPASQ